MDAGPGDKVPAGLLNHVHLLSAHTYPHHPQQLSLESVLNELMSAPRIVGSMKSVAWQYLAPPRDGTILLAWQPTVQMGTTYASDGYIFPEPEQVFHQKSRDFTIEIYLCDSGYIPAHREPVATRRRVRYRLIASPNGEPVDSHLELVHYTTSPQEKHLPPQAIPVTDHQRKLHQERRYLEEQGTLVRKEFMLQDQSNWPAISQPGRPSVVPPNPYQRGPGHPGAGFPPMARPPGPAQPPYNQMGAPRQSGIGPSPAKRPRHAGPMRPDVPSIDDDEALNQMGDALDLLSPREISITRYTQHHEWMEEVLSSPYAVSRILPVDVGFKLGGELSGLTKGLFDNAQPDDQPREIDEEQVRELERRVTEFQAQGQEEMLRMKEEHKKRMEQLSEQRLFIDLEQRLASAAFDSPGQSTDGVADMMREVESSTGSKVKIREEIRQVQKGGLLAPEEAVARNASQNNANGTAQQSHVDEFAEFANLDSAGEALDFYASNYEDAKYTT